MLRQPRNAASGRCAAPFASRRCARPSSKTLALRQMQLSILVQDAGLRRVVRHDLVDPTDLRHHLRPRGRIPRSWFALIAAVAAPAAPINGRLVMRLGMRPLVRGAPPGLDAGGPAGGRADRPCASCRGGILGVLRLVRHGFSRWRGSPSAISTPSPSNPWATSRAWPPRSWGRWRRWAARRLGGGDRPILRRHADATDPGHGAFVPAIGALVMRFMPREIA